MAHNFPSLITEMISWLCFVKASLLCKEDKKIQTNIVEKICKQYKKRIKGVHHEEIVKTCRTRHSVPNNMFKYIYRLINCSCAAAVCQMG
ncbi:hypothetical protein FML83_08765 [Bacillus thuringiensis]|uniref:Uncharacterized protein n=1 Tax=Bacillus thuringiensis TaxID=1428 RepID=A0AAP4Q5H9_BACTU|nr:hypothetical protein F8510_11415 [Bacillus sp. RM2(2019)]MBN6705241.1 hypothetical protein [Bacillus thuringiensis]MDN7078115.1 hypothetical protein [Bacillus thuringiensis]MDQ7256282.1 hypothetical protein [Bacillus thuringiensis]MDR5029742.1 hypothetical protein [Bacillus thuringiensis]